MLRGNSENVDLFEIALVFLLKKLYKILYGCNKVIFLCSCKGVFVIKASTGSEVMMTSNCDDEIVGLSSAMLKT